MNVRFKRIKKKIINELNKLDKKIDSKNYSEKKEEKKKDNKGIKLIKTFIKDIYFKFGEANIKKMKNMKYGFLF